MHRRTALAVIAIGLALYGVYVALYLPALIAGTPAPLLLAGFVAQACAALLAAVGTWRDAPWAAFALVVLGAAVAATEIIEGYVLGLIAYNHAVVVAVIGLLITIAIAAYIRRARPLPA